MAKEVVQERGLAIRLACAVFSISESCYRYEAKPNAENEIIADWLNRLTHNHRSMGSRVRQFKPPNLSAFQ